MSFTSLVEKMKDIITSTRIDDVFLENMHVTMDELYALGWNDDTQLTWIEACLLMIPGMSRDVVQDKLPICMKRFESISIRMATHLQLTADNIDRSAQVSYK